MHYYFKRPFVWHSLEVIFSFLIIKSRQKAIEIETAFFSSPWESQGSHIGSFLLCFRYPPKFPLQTDTYIDELVKSFFEVMNENSLSVFNYLDDFTVL